MAVSVATGSWAARISGPRQGLPEGLGVSPVKFRRGLDWFRGLAQGPGWKVADGLKRHYIKDYARGGRQDHGQNCSDYDSDRT